MWKSISLQICLSVLSSLSASNYLARTSLSLSVINLASCDTKSSTSWADTGRRRPVVIF
jgi:hypothetical protein